MKLDSYDDGESYWRIACECASSNHDVSLYFETDKDSRSFSLNLAMEVSSNNPIELYHNVGDSRWYWLEWLIDNITWRIKTATKILFLGRIEVSGDVLLDQDGIAAMQVALEEGKRHTYECMANKTKSDLIDNELN